MKKTVLKYFFPAGLILIYFLHLLIIFAVKYRSHNIPFSEFGLFNIGNFTNSLLTLIIILLIIPANRKGTFQKYRGRFILTVFISTLCLIAAELSKHIIIPLPDFYLFDNPFTRIFTGILFTVYQFTIFYMIFLLWYSAAQKSNAVILRAGVNSLLAMILILVLTAFYISPVKEQDEILQIPGNGKNIGVVLGAAVWSNNIPSPSLAARSEKAARLYREKKIDKIQLTGSNAPGELSEAEVAFRHILKFGVDSSDVWLEDKTTSTTEQIFFIKHNLLDKKNDYNVVVISDSYHLTRVKEIGKFYRINIHVAASDLSASFENMVYYKLRESIALLAFWFFAL